MILLPINDDQHRRVERAVAKFSASWSTISPERGATALKMLVLCELIGGRGRAVKALGLRDNTIDNYRHGRTEPRYSALEVLARVAMFRRLCSRRTGNMWADSCTSPRYR
jgi:hypothetical protein